MRDELINDTEHDVIELGAASEVTRGIPDQLKKENLTTPFARDF